MPSSVYALTGLQILSAACKQIVRLQPEIRELRSLQTLWLDGNGLKSQPNECGLQESLEDLSLHHNQLSDLPPK